MASIATGLRFSDLGKNANDLLNKDFPIGMIKVEGRGAEKSGDLLTKYVVTGTRDTSSGALTGEVKHTLAYALKSPRCCARLLETSTTVNATGTLTQQVDIKDALLRGINLTSTGTLIHGTGLTNLKVGLELLKPIGPALLSTVTSADVLTGPLVNHDTTVAIGETVLGGEVGYNVNKGRIEKYNLGMTHFFKSSAFTLQGLNGLNVVNASFYQLLTNGGEVCYKTSWNRKAAGVYSSPSSSNVTMEFGAKFPLQHGSYMKAKVDSLGRVGMSYSSLINPNLTLTVAASVPSGLKADDLPSRIGLGLSFNY